MVAKLSFLIISMGAVACVLLALRQQRIEAVSEMARVHLRIMESDRGVAQLRTEIASHIEPKRIESLALAMGPLRPLQQVPARGGSIGGQNGPAFAQGDTGRSSVRQPRDDGAFGGGVNRR